VAIILQLLILFY